MYSVVIIQRNYVIAQCNYTVYMVPFLGWCRFLLFSGRWLPSKSVCSEAFVQILRATYKIIKECPMKEESSW
jgi:hypothetical protein